MYQLNVDAVNERYQENNDPDLSFKARHEFANRIQVLKSLRCWLYQCTEGEAVTRPLYTAMETLRHFLALEIVESMPPACGGLCRSGRHHYLSRRRPARAR